MTSNSYADAAAIQIEDDDFSVGSLHRISFARPGKIFTANQALMASQAGKLKDASFRKVAGAVVHLLQTNIPI